MTKFKLGNTDIETSPIVFGGNVFGWTLNEKESFDILDTLLGMGINTIDTANSYSHWVEGNSGGESEIIIGKWMKSRENRSRINIITKVGSGMGQGKRDISESHILKEVEESLRRLQIDEIDLYLTHWDDDKTPVEETLGAYQKLIKAGKVRNIGASNLSPERLNESLEASAKNGLPRYEVFQPGYNLYDRKEYENGVAPICQEHGLGVITYSSLASGFLTGKYRDEEDFNKSVRGGGVKKYLDHRGKKILKALDQISLTRDISQAAVSLAWLIQNPKLTAPIASATSNSQLKSFAEAIRTKLTDGEMKILTKVSEY